VGVFELARIQQNAMALCKSIRMQWGYRYQYLRVCIVFALAVYSMNVMQSSITTIQRDKGINDSNGATLPPEFPSPPSCDLGCGLVTNASLDNSHYDGRALMQTSVGGNGDVSGEVAPSNNGAEGVVPNCIHFLYKFVGSDEIPEKYVPLLEKWEDQNPSHCIMKHTPEDILDLLHKRSSGQWLRLFESYAHSIQKCDVARYILMLYSGGTYTDLDTENNQKILAVLNNHPEGKVFLGVERVIPTPYAAAMAAHKIRNGTEEHPVRVANYWMMSAPGHPFWLHVLQMAEERASLPVSQNYDVLYTTGPDLLTEAYHTYRQEDKNHEVVLLGKSEFLELLNHRSDGFWKSKSMSSTDWRTFVNMARIILVRELRWLYLPLLTAAVLLVVWRKDIGRAILAQHRAPLNS